MSRFLRNKHTQEYLGPNGVWTKDFGGAVAFASIDSLFAAAVECWAKGIETEEVLMFFATPSDYDVALPINVSEARH